MRKRTGAALPQLIRRRHLLLPVLLLVSMASLHGQLALESFMLVNGGSSSGENYELSGAVQPTDAADLTGGGYTLSSGFWSFVPTPPPSVPTLRVVRVGAFVTLAWTSLSEGFQLQESSRLTSPEWSDVNAIPTLVGQERQVKQPLASAVRFYRLRRS